MLLSWNLLDILANGMHIVCTGGGDRMTFLEGIQCHNSWILLRKILNIGSLLVEGGFWREAKRIEILWKAWKSSDGRMKPLTPLILPLICTLPASLRKISGIGVLPFHRFIRRPSRQCTTWIAGLKWSYEYISIHHYSTDNRILKKILLRKLGDIFPPLSQWRMQYV